MASHKSESPFVLTSKVRKAVVRATFGGPVTEAKILADHCTWNGLLNQAGCKTCWFQENKSHSGCRLPMCPRCALRARLKVIKGVLSWHWRQPEAQLSLLEQRIVSTHPADFLHLFDRTIVRRTQGRSRNASRVVASITTTAWAGRIKLPGYMIAEDEAPVQPRWIHRRLTVLWHDAAQDIPRIRGSQPVIDRSMVTETIHSHPDDLAEDSLVWYHWRTPEHQGKLIAGALLGRFDNIAGYLAQSGAPGLEFVARLRSSGTHRRYSRVNTPPGGW